MTLSSSKDVDARQGRVRLAPAQLLAALKRRWEWRFSPTYRWDNIQVAFIVSTGRTGTMFLAKFLDDHVSGVLARHEPFPDLLEQSISYFRGELSRTQARDAFAQGRRKNCNLTHLNRCDHYVESNNFLSYMLPALKELFPQARFVHVTRSGPEFVRSIMSKQVGRSKGSEPALFMSENDTDQRLRGTDFPDEDYADRWNSMSRFERICWYWMRHDRLLHDQLENYSNAMRVKFEDIIDAQRGFPGVWSTLEFLGLADRFSNENCDLRRIFSHKSNGSESYTIPHWNDWTPAQRQQFVEIAGAHMERCGYETPIA